METNNQLLSGILSLHSGTPRNVFSVGYGKKIRNNELTNINSIVFGVEKKIPLSELIASGSYIVPEKITIEGVEYKTDVVETQIPQALNCANYNPSINQNALPPEINRHRVNTSPLKGGVVIKPERANWRGTLGLICVDSETKCFVGLTNAHVGFYPEPVVFYNTGFFNLSTHSWRARQEIIQFTENLTPINNNSSTIYTNNSIGYVKKFSPMIDGWTDFKEVTNCANPPCPIRDRYHTVDAAIISLNECGPKERGDFFIVGNGPYNTKYQVINLQESFKQLGIDYNEPMPFANTAEINSLIDTPRNIYSVGRSTGVKGYENCRMSVTSVFYASYVGFGENQPVFYDCIQYQPVNSQWIIYGGDSGSILIADFDGIFKIIGLVFAGTSVSNGFGLACRIDRISEMLGIEAWSNQQKYFAKNNDIKVYVEDYSTLTGNFRPSVFQSDWPIKKTIPGSGDFWFMGLAKISDLTGIGIAGARTYDTQSMNLNPITQSSLVEKQESSCVLGEVIFSK